MENEDLRDLVKENFQYSYKRRLVRVRRVRRLLRSPTETLLTEGLLLVDPDSVPSFDSSRPLVWSVNIFFSTRTSSVGIVGGLFEVTGREV